MIYFPLGQADPSRQSRLVETAITPNEDHFVRNHGGIPEIEEDDFELEIDGLVKKPMKLRMKDLKNEKLFPRQSSVVTIQCSGTRRIEQIQLYPGDGQYLPYVSLYNVSLTGLIRRRTHQRTLGRRGNRQRTLDRCISPKRNRTLWRLKNQRRKSRNRHPHGILRRRHILQERQRNELCRQRTIAKMQV